MSHETDELKRDLERLRLEHNLTKADHDRDLRNLARRVDSLESVIANGSVTDGVISVPALEQRLGAIEEAMPSSTAELLALASTRVAGLLGMLAHDEATTIRKLEAAAERLPSRTISTNGSPYLTRWYLWPAGPRDADDEGSDLPFAAFLHKFHRGDADRDQHNHPWDLSVAIVLAGGYREERGEETRVVLPGTVNVIRGDDFHRVDLLNPAMGSWSLFVAGRKTSGWGFRDRVTGAFIPQKDYLAAKGLTE
jgi:hypothetical protein